MFVKLFYIFKLILHRSYNNVISYRLYPTHTFNMRNCSEVELSEVLTEADREYFRSVELQPDPKEKSFEKFCSQGITTRLVFDYLVLQLKLCIYICIYNLLGKYDIKIFRTCV